MKMNKKVLVALMSLFLISCGSFSSLSYSSQDYSDESSDHYSISSESSDKTVYYTVSFYVDDEVYQTQNVEEGQLALEIPHPDKEGKAFSGWYSGDNLWDFSEDKVYGDLSLYAHYVNNTYNIYIENDDSYGSITGEGTYNYGDPVTLKCENSYGWYLDGWYEDDNKLSSASEYTFLMPSHDIHIMVKYSKAHSVGFDYLINDNNHTAYINGLGSCTDTDIVIPDYTEEGYPVKGMATAVLFANKNITTLKLNSLWTSFNMASVLGCTNLKSIYFGKSIANISFGSYVFYYQKSAEGTILPDEEINISSCTDTINLTSIQVDEENPNFSSGAYNGVFDKEFTSLYCGCPSTEIPETVNTICANAFSHTSLTSFEITENIKTIESNAFSYSLLENITIPSWVKLNIQAFQNCHNIKNVVFHRNVIFGFEYCESLEKVTIECDGNITIDINAFYNSGLKEIILPENTTEIRHNAFAYTKIKELCVPKNVISIAETAFTGNVNLEKIEVEEGNTIYSSPENSNALINNYVKNNALSSWYNTVYDHVLVLGCKNTVIPNAVSVVGEHAFAGSGITEVTIPARKITFKSGCFADSMLKKATIYGTYAMEGIFRNSHILSDVTLDCEKMTIDDSMFAGCDSLESLELPSSVTQIGDYAFSNCENIQNIIVNSKIKEIGRFSFRGCKSLNNIDFLADCEMDYIPCGVFSGCSSLIRVRIPEQIITIESQSFENCTSLKEVSFNSLLQTIGENAFYNDSSLQNIKLPDSVQSFANSAFWCCNSVTELIIGRGIKNIKKESFSSLNIKSVVIPSSVEIIEGRIFGPSIEVIYCESETKPDGWSNDFKVDSEGRKIDVVWGYTS